MVVVDDNGQRQSTYTSTLKRVFDKARQKLKGSQMHKLKRLKKPEVVHVQPYLPLASVLHGATVAAPLVVAPAAAAAAAVVEVEEAPGGGGSTGGSTSSQ